MNEKNTEIFKNLFPSLFDEDFYFECNDGWYKIIFDLSKEITAKTNKCHAVQVKEKFGGLRYYIEWTEDDGIYPSIDEDTARAISDLIFKAENKSYLVCEICGENKTRKDKYCQDCSKALFS